MLTRWVANWVTDVGQQAFLVIRETRAGLWSCAIAINALSRAFWVAIENIVWIRLKSVLALAKVNSNALAVDTRFLADDPADFVW